MTDRYVRAPWGPGQVIKYRDTGTSYQGAPVYVVEAALTNDLASQGLLAAIDTNSYRIGEIERHLHSYERWFGAGSSQNTLSSFQLDSGNNTWGAWVALLTAGSTPVGTGNKYYDPHRLLVTATERNSVYRVQLGFGASGAAALAAGAYTEVMFIPDSNLVDSAPISVNSRRIAVGTPMWGRTWNADNTGTINFFVGLHEYEG